MLALFETIFLPPKWIFSDAKKYTQTNLLLFSELNFLYNSEGEMTSLELTTVNTLNTRNLPN